MEKRKRSTQRSKRKAICLLGIVIVGGIFTAAAKDVISVVRQMQGGLDASVYPQELIDLWERNEEARDFVVDYPKYKDRKWEIDLSKEAEQDGIPLLLQWDRRWGYEAYGSSMIAVTGCGPTCLSMVYIGLTGDDSMNPKKMAAFSEKKEYYTENGTSWDLMTKGAEALGLSAEELPLDENRIRQCLLDGEPVICSMGPGDFTREGHFIVLTGVDGEGKILLHDPNSRRNSEVSWEYERLAGQIKNLWGFQKI